MAAADMAVSAARRGQRLDIDVTSGIAPIVTDAQKLRDALRNLLENAMNYGPKGGTITLEARQSDTALVLRVLDEGPGIPETEIGR